MLLSRKAAMARRVLVASREITEEPLVAELRGVNPKAEACKRGRAERHASHNLGSMDLNIMGQALINVDPSFQHLHISLYCLYRDRIANSAPSPIPCPGRTSTCEATPSAPSCAAVGLATSSSPLRDLSHVQKKSQGLLKGAFIAHNPVSCLRSRFPPP